MIWWKVMSEFEGFLLVYSESAFLFVFIFCVNCVIWSGTERILNMDSKSYRVAYFKDKYKNNKKVQVVIFVTIIKSKSWNHIKTPYITSIAVIFSRLGNFISNLWSLVKKVVKTNQSFFSKLCTFNWNNTWKLIWNILYFSVLKSSGISSVTFRQTRWARWWKLIDFGSSKRSRRRNWPTRSTRIGRIKTGNSKSWSR